MALKLLRPERTGDSVHRARFLRESLLGRRIESRHVAPVVDVGDADGVAYLAMPLYTGGSLAERLRRSGRLELDETVRLAAELASGLDALHACGILHRDVKPSNVLFGLSGAVLADFGLARAGDSTRLTRDGDLLGTLHYLAPELIEGSDATAASDIYALGCVLYECVTGAPAFAGATPAAVGFAHLAEPPPDPRERRTGLPPEVAEALLTPLRKDPQERPTTATALVRLLHAAHTAARA